MSREHTEVKMNSHEAEEEEEEEEETREEETGGSDEANLDSVPFPAQQGRSQSDSGDEGGEANAASDGDGTRGGVFIRRKRKKSHGTSMYSEEELQRKRDKEAERRERLNGAYGALMEVVYELDTTLKSGRESTIIHRQLNQSNNVMNKTDLVTRAVNVIRNLWDENTRLKAKVKELSPAASSSNTEDTPHPTMRSSSGGGAAAAAATAAADSLPSISSPSPSSASSRQHATAGIDPLTATRAMAAASPAAAMANLLSRQSLLQGGHPALANLLLPNAHGNAALGLQTPLVGRTDLLQVESLNSLLGLGLNQHAAAQSILASGGGVGLPFAAGLQPALPSLSNNSAAVSALRQRISAAHGDDRASASSAGLVADSIQSSNLSTEAAARSQQDSNNDGTMRR